jgi:hypothetical protein
MEIYTYNCIFVLIQIDNIDTLENICIDPDYFNIVPGRPSN